jgi:bifunctional DNase/RNase
MIKEVFKITFYPPSKGYAVVLKEINGNRQLPVIVGAFEAQAIALAHENVEMPRPMTHDLLANILETLDVEVREVIVSDLRDGTFYARILIESYQFGNKEIDSRPSDAVALALRLDAPIFVDEAVMEEAGVIAESESVEKRTRRKSGEDTLESLRKQLDQAIKNEEYEKAAVLRDKIKKLEIQRKDS